jgi:ribonuclease HIII
MRKYALSDPAARRRDEAALRSLPDHTERPEQSCAYRLDFAARGERVVAKQYTSGTLFLQSATKPGPLFQTLVDAVESSGATAAALGKPPGPSRAPKGSSVGVDVEHPFDPPWIGSDESGKGDYFGPLVACAVWVDDRTLGLLDTLGVRDSKALSDAQNRRLAQEVRLICRTDGPPGGTTDHTDRFAEVIVPPDRYNALYDQFRREGKNLNALLAWGHARAIETVLQNAPAAHAIVDQFADARYIRDRLASRDATKALDVVQLPRAEANLAVAAASVLSRDRFLGWLEHAARQHGVRLPKGASDEVEAAARQLVQRHGPDLLGKVAKLHFKTTQRVLVAYQPRLAAAGD